MNSKERNVYDDIEDDIEDQDVVIRIDESKRRRAVRELPLIFGDRVKKDYS